MTRKPHISIAAFVSEGERAAVQLATRHLARALSQAADIPWTCDSVFSPDMETLRQGGDAAIIVTSFLPELGEIEEPWPRAEQRLRTAYAALGQRGVPVFICTILRHVVVDEGPDAAAALRIRIRRLNLLAAKISHESGAYVIDLDRVLADIGARRLQTDYRLAGNAAAEMAGHFIALTLINNGLDAFVSFEVQDAAKAILTASQPAIARSDSDKPVVTIWKPRLSLGQKRRKQIVTPVRYPEENYVGWLVQQVLRGRIGPAEVFQGLVQTVRRRGVRETAVLFVSGLSKQINRKK